MAACYLINFPVMHPLIQTAVPAFRILGLDLWEQVFMVIENMRHGGTGHIYKQYIAQLDRVMEEEMSYYVDSPAEQYIAQYYVSHYGDILIMLEDIWRFLEHEYLPFHHLPFCYDLSINISRVDIVQSNALIYTETAHEAKVRYPTNALPAPTTVRANVNTPTKQPYLRKPLHYQPRRRLPNRS